MDREPVIFAVSDVITQSENPLEHALRERYTGSYRVAGAEPEADPAPLLHAYRDRGERIALFVFEQRTSSSTIAAFIAAARAIYPGARQVLLAASPDFPVNRDQLDHYIAGTWYPPDRYLYPVIDELLADWRSSVTMPFMSVSGIMTVRTVRIRSGDTLHRAAEMIALSGVGDLMVIDNDNNFVGVLSVGDVLRAAMPDMDEILEEGGTLEQAFRLFLRKGSELMYKPITPLIISNPLVVAPDDHVARAAALMLEKNIHRLPVVKDGQLVGTVGRADICQAVVGTL